MFYPCVALGVAGLLLVWAALAYSLWSAEPAADLPADAVLLPRRGEVSSGLGS